MFFVDPYQIYALCFPESGSKVPEKLGLFYQQDKREACKIARRLIERPKGRYIDKKGVMALEHPLTETTFAQYAYWAMRTELGDYLECVPLATVTWSNHYSQWFRVQEPDGDMNAIVRLEMNRTTGAWIAHVVRHSAWLSPLTMPVRVLPWQLDNFLYDQ